MSLKPFLVFIQNHPRLKLNLILAAVLLALIPYKNDYYQLDLSQSKPLVRPTNYQFLPLSDYPVKIDNQPAPFITSRSAIIIDASSKTILYAKNPDLKLLPASTTKIMTALVALDNYQLNDILTINEIQTEPVVMKLEPGEKISVENLLYGLLVGSANDAALALAQNYPGGESNFIIAMNQKAIDLHLTSTQFTNPVGFDNFGQYTTVHDLSLLTAIAMDSPVIRRLVSTAVITVSDTDNTVTHKLENLNQLLGKVPGLSGVKTGFTQLAGECLVTYTKRDGRALIVVILSGSDRFIDAQSLIDWAFTHFTWQGLPEASR
ncbi:MAG: D-alanyl-D-alanine carboxypeptidase family protein [Candidatus Beckwithbacteria bacterium]